MTDPKRRKAPGASGQQPQRPASTEQSGSTGRDPGPSSRFPGIDGKPGTGDNTGQGNYGQSGFGQGGFGKGGGAESTYQKDLAGRDARSHTSNRGSGRRESAEDENKVNSSQPPGKSNGK